MSAENAEATVAGPRLPLLPGGASGGPQTALLHLDGSRRRKLTERAAARGLTPAAVLATAFTEVLALWSKDPAFSLRWRDAAGGRTVTVDAAPDGTFLDRARRCATARDAAPPAAGAPVPAVEFADELGGPAVHHPDAEPPALALRIRAAADGGVTAVWEAAPGALPAGMPEDMAHSWSALLAVLEDDADAWTAPGSPVRLPAAQERARAEVNATAGHVPEGLLHEAVGRAAARHPERTAVVAGDRRLTYAELTSRARRIGRRIRALGAEPGQLVALCMEKGWEQPVGVLGVLESGAAWVPLDPAVPAERRKYVLETTEARIVLTQRSLAGRWDWPAGVTVLAVDDDTAWAGVDDGPLEPAQTPSDTAYVLFTSGSTGRPKGVMVPHRGALNSVHDVITRYGITCEDRFLALSAATFDLSVLDLFGALCAGAALVLPDPGTERSPAHWLDLVRREAVTTWISAPALFELFCEQVEEDDEPWADSLRLLIVGGDWIPLSLPARARDIAPDARFVGLGGNTEASILTTTYDVDTVDPAWTSIPYGRPLTNQTVHVLDAALRPRPAGVPGDLYFGGTGLAIGYWRDPERTAAAFLTHPGTGERLYRTGDLGRFRPDGHLELLGREDFQVKVAGHRIELGEVETALRTHPAVDAAVVVALPRRDGEPGHRALAGYVTPAGAALPRPEELRAHLAERLPAALCPAHLAVLETLPLTAHGKVDRAALPDPGDLPAEPSDGTGGDAPRTPLEAELADLWSEILGVDRVGVHDTFFELGGNSLLGIRVMNRLRERIGVAADPHSIFRHRTVAELALAVDRERVRAEGRDAAHAGLPAVRPEPAAAHEPFPLTDQQQAYCVGRTGALSSGNVSAHVYLEYEGEGLDPERFRRAWQRVIDRHPMLRAVILPETMEQRVLESPPPYAMPVVDLRDAGEEGVRDGLAAIRERHSHEVRPMDTWPLFEVVVAELPADRFRVHFSIDALCTDLAGLRIAFDDLSRAYADPDAELAPPPMTYRDYVLATAGLDRTEQHRRSAAYWERRLPALPPAPRLPMVRSPESVTEPRFVRRSVRIPAERWDRLVARAGEAGLTPAGLLLAAYAEALAPWAQEPRFTLNVTNLNRLPVHPEVHGTVGEFASFALVEVDTGGGDGFAVRARRIQEQLWSDLSHSYVSGVHLLRELMRQRGGFDGALMPMVFTSAVPLAGGTAGLLGGLLRQVGGITQTPQVWMDLLTEVQDGDLVVNWDVQEALFDPELVDEVFAGLGGLLERLADADGDSAWTAPDPLPPATRLSPAGLGDGGTRALPDRLVHDAFREQAALRPDAPAVIAADRTLTYAELHREAARVAHWLRARGAAPGRPVGIVLDKGWAQIVAAYAVLYTGAPYLPVDPDAPAERTRALLDRCGAGLVLTRRGLAERAGGERESLCLDEPLPVDVPDTDEPPASAATPSDLAYVLFTSGSSGRPKGVMTEHRGVVNALRETVEEFGVGPGDRVLALTALHHDMSVFDVFGVLGAGGTLVMPEAAQRREAAHWARLLADHRITLWNSVPAMMEMLLEHLGPDLGALEPLRLAFLGGDWLSVPAVRRLTEEAGVEVVSVGGPTETTLWNIRHRVRRLEPGRRTVPYGTPIANTRYRILDERLRDRPVWATGEMYVAGVGLARGYWDDPERTAASFVTHPETGERLYRTGDLGRFLPDGTIEFVGRADFQIQVGGHRIEPGEVEAALLTHPDVTAAVVTGRRAAAGPGHRGLTGYVVPAAGADRDGLPGRLREHLRSALPGHMVPSAFAVLDALPLNANGKVDRAALPEPAPEPAGSPDAPRSAVAEVCAGVWAEVLDRPAVGEHENFFALGGDSVLATRIVTRLRQVFTSDGISLRTLFLSPTVAGLAEAITAGEDVPGRSEAVAGIHLRVSRMTPEEVARELSARRAVVKDGAGA